MAAEVTNVVIAGLGGQGVLKASDILAEAAFQAGYKVKKAEVHGMSQRGGSVSSDVRFGTDVLSPMVPTGEADFLVALEPSQAEGARHRLRSGAVELTSDSVDLSALATPKALNVAMLGMLSAFLDIPETSWMEAVRAALPERLHQANADAFQYGRTEGEKEKSNG